ncbi:MAG: hypothetical protein M0P61_00225 [Ignavibacteriaceae bacterium]|jgi:hypothetical protein|nr:hypothetical protein [Ignavibacteriaceae bacterium]
MGRFSGWTAGAVAKLQNNKIERFDDKESTIKIRIKKKDEEDVIGKIVSALSAIGFKATREYKFLRDRRFRFDMALPAHKIAFEFEGGVYSQGRHVRGKGYTNDCKKYTLAAMEGWTLLRYTVDVTKEKNYEYRIADDIRRLIEK